MPGITLVVGLGASEALTAAQHDGYDRRIVFDAARMRLGALAYAAYPVATVEAGWGAAVFEGAAFGPSEQDVTRTLATLGAGFCAGLPGAREAIERWAAGMDGDFVIAVVARDGTRALVVNDRLGRLPLYWARTDSATVIAREVKAVRA